MSSTPSDLSASSSLVPEVKSKDFSEQFKGKVGGEEAFKLAERIDLFTLSDLCLLGDYPQDEFIQLMIFLGHDSEDNINICVRMIVKTILLGWKDLVTSERDSLNHL